LQNAILPGVKSKQKFTMTFAPNQKPRFKDNLIYEKALLQEQKKDFTYFKKGRPFFS